MTVSNEADTASRNGTRDRLCATDCELEASGAMPVMPGRPAPGYVSVYRLYSGADDLLYVGIAADPLKRWREHARTKQWWARVASFHVRWYPSLREAENAELVAIRVERPEHNSTHNRPNPWNYHVFYDRVLAGFGYEPFTCHQLDEQLGCPYSSTFEYIRRLRVAGMIEQVGTEPGTGVTPRRLFRLRPKPSAE